MRDYTEDEYNEFFKQLFEREYPGLLRYASSILKSLDSSSPVSSRAEDAVQEAFPFIESPVATGFQKKHLTEMTAE